MLTIEIETGKDGSSAIIGPSFFVKTTLDQIIVLTKSKYQRCNVCITFNFKIAKTIYIIKMHAG